jgi:cell division protein FtsQ
MWRLDLDAERATIALQPWVRRVSIRRDWPDRVIVDIAERRPVASYPALDGEWRIVDADGRVLMSILNQPRDFPAVVADQTPFDPGESTGPTIMAGALVAQALPAEIKVRLSEIRVTPSGSVELHFVDQGPVLIGTPDNLREKLISTLAALERCRGKSVNSIDVRAATEVVISPAGACPARDR